MESYFNASSILSEEELGGLELVRSNRLNSPNHKPIGTITSTGGYQIGTGVLILSNLVLSLVNRKRVEDLAQENIDQYFSFNWNEPSIPKMMSSKIQKFKFATVQRKSKTQNEFCLITLKSQIHPRGYQDLALTVPCSICCMMEKDTLRLTFYGYSIESTNLESQKPKQYGTSNSRLLNMEENSLICSISAKAGQEGSPIFYKGKIIGFIGRGINGKAESEGRPISFKMMGNLKKWCDQLNGEVLTSKNRISKDKITTAENSAWCTLSQKGGHKQKKNLFIQKFNHFYQKMLIRHRYFETDQFRLSLVPHFLPPDPPFTSYTDEQLTFRSQLCTDSSYLGLPQTGVD